MNRNAKVTPLIAAILAMIGLVFSILIAVVPAPFMSLFSAPAEALDNIRIPVVPLVSSIIYALLIIFFWIYCRKSRSSIVFEIILMVLLGAVLGWIISLLNVAEIRSLAVLAGMGTLASYSVISSAFSISSVFISVASMLVMVACGYNIVQKKGSMLRLEKPGFFVLLACLILLILVTLLQKVFYPVFVHDEGMLQQMSNTMLIPFASLITLIAEIIFALLLFINGKSKGLAIAAVIVIIVFAIALAPFLSLIQQSMYNAMGTYGAAGGSVLNNVVTYSQFARNAGVSLVMAGAGMIIARARQ